MRLLLLITTLLMLSACGEKPATTQPEAKQTFADPQIQAYEKAREVQGVMDAAEKDQQQQMREEGL